MKKIIVWIVVAIVLWVGGNAWYKQTPQYSLIKIKYAYENKDVVEFEKYVDIDSVSNDIIDDYADYVSQLISEKSGLGGKIGKTLAETIIEKLAPKYKLKLADSIRTLIATGAAQFETDYHNPIKLEDSLSVLYFGINQLSALSRMPTEGDYAQFEISQRFDINASPLLIQIKLRKKGNRWEVYEVGTDDIISRLKEFEKKRIF